MMRFRKVISDDGGVYAVLYALLVLVLVGMGALVVDLAILRQERRVTRLATDAGVTAGALKLNPLAGVEPQAACEEAWTFSAANLGLTPGSSPCGSFPLTGASCPSTATQVSGTVGPYTLTITWPVPDGHTLMTNPTVQGGMVQAIDPARDGDAVADPSIACTRLGMTVARTRTSAFAGIFGIASSPVNGSSVARGLGKIANPPAIAALNVLEPHACDTIRTSGQGFIQINAVLGPLGPMPGIINVESDGRPTGPGSSCPASKPWVINPLSNPLNYIRANGLRPDGTQDPGNGFIRQWALSGSGNNADAYDPMLVPAVISPQPTPLTGLSGVVPVTKKYGSTTDAGSPLYNLISSFQAATGVVPVPYAGAMPPYDAAPFQTLPGPAVPGFACTTNVSDPPIIVPVGNWYLNCPPAGPDDIGLTLGSPMIFQGGTIVVDGGIETKQSTGCLVVNVNTTTCPAAGTTPPPNGDSILYLRAGELIKGAQSQIFMPQTFTYVRNGTIDMGAGDGTLFWSRPKAADCASAIDPLQCKYERFGGMVLWSEGADDHNLGGQASLSLIGVLFTPNTHFTYTGKPIQNQTQAQFWTREIEVTGQSGLIMAPDPEDAIATPVSGVALLR